MRCPGASIRLTSIILLLACLATACASARKTHVVTGSNVQGALELYIARVRAVSHEAAAPRPPAVLQSLESTDPGLKAALAKLAAAPSPEAHHAVAAAYLRARITDQAFDHFTAAIRLDPADATAYDALARIWRDWGFAHLGLADAHRAIFYAPSSPSAHNTLGTLLQALEMPEEARRAYSAALALDSRAAYAWNNLCALDLHEGRLTEALDACRQALAFDPTLLAARRNLAVLDGFGAGSGEHTATAVPGVPSGRPRPPGE